SDIPPMPMRCSSWYRPPSVRISAPCPVTASSPPSWLRPTYPRLRRDKRGGRPSADRGEAERVPWPRHHDDVLVDVAARTDAQRHPGRDPAGEQLAQAAAAQRGRTGPGRAAHPGGLLAHGALDGGEVHVDGPVLRRAEVLERTG